MKKFDMKTGSISSIESMGLVDGPGIRVVVFFTGCKLRCKYCHNPENWVMQEKNMTSLELVNKIKRFKPYFENGGGVTFSGGEPLLQIDFLIEVCQMLKKENIHIALDTCGVGIGRYEEILPLVDLVIFDVKHVEKDEYLSLVEYPYGECERFIEMVRTCNTPLWIRQVIIPDLTDSSIYLKKLATYLKSFPKISKIEFLPYHTLGKEKYQKLKIPYPFEDKKDMDIEKCKLLYEEFLTYYG